MLGPQFFVIYTGPITKIAQKHNLNVHLYADDTQLYLSFDAKLPGDELLAVSRVQDCANDIKKWMRQNKLKLNDDKTEFMIMSSKRQQRHVSSGSIMIGDSEIKCTSKVRNLGIMFDNTMSMQQHVKKMCQSGYFHLRNINSIRKILTKENTEKLIHAFVSSRLDCGNSLLFGIPEHLIHRLQLIQNAAARSICMIRKYDHITPSLQTLHWLPIHQRIIFKICLLTWKSLHGQAPSYISDMLEPYKCQKPGLRSSKQNLLCIPSRTCKTFGDRAFSVAAPTIWNKLPMTLRQCETINSFKCKLKTYLFLTRHMMIINCS